MHSLYIKSEDSKSGGQRSLACPSARADRPRHCLRRLLLLVGCLLLGAPSASALQTEYVLLVTLDGVRWQEIFGGADEALLINRRYVADPAALKERFWAEDGAVRRKLLLPFLWGSVATQGQLYGNRQRRNRVDVSNRYRISYSGYSELLTGYADDARITSNRRRYNPNVTVLEYANRQPALQGRVASFASWDAFPWIINDRRAGVLVNAGFREAMQAPLSSREQFLNALQRQVPSPWQRVRLDAFTHQFALEHLRNRHPRLLFIAHGETDEYAHEGRYDAYLHAAQRSDAMIRELWQWTQAHPGYRNKTTLLITTDHGRGSGRHWRDHGIDVEGSQAIWLAAIGPDTSPLGEVGIPMRIEQNQVAATLAALLQLDYHSGQRIGPAIASVLK